MSLGPIEVLVLAFPGNRFNGAILPELERLVSERIISIVDAVLVRRDGVDDDPVIIELEDLGADPEVARLAELVDRFEDLISDEDVAELAANLEPNSSEAILVFEHTWAKPFKQAVTDSGGILVADFRVPGPVVDEVMAAVAELD